MGNKAADEAADFARRRIEFPVIDARRNFAGVCGRWYPVILILHRFFIAISRAAVDHVDGDGTAPDPLVWSAGALPKKRRLVHAVRDPAFLPGLAGIWDGEWVAFLGSLHWPAAGGDLGVWSVSLVEVLILYELWAGERLVLEKAVPLGIVGMVAQFQCRLFRLDQALIFGVLAGSSVP